jgi:alkylation response protein AidB-like acyl-CoA dehydrogenase
VGATLDNVRDLTPRISQLAPTIEVERALPADLLAELKRAGVFRMYVPKSHGGDELPPIEVVRVIEEISRADASVGWLATIGTNTPAIFAFLPPETYDKIYANGPDVIQAGSLIPRGRAVATEGGYLFTGQWPFASGCNHADYIDFASFVERPPNGGSSGSAPKVRFGVVPAGEVGILDTWHVSGLKGTGSHDFEATDLFVPDGWTGSFLDPAPVVRHPLDAVRPLGRLGLELAAVAVGTAQGAIDDLIEIGRTKKPLGGLMKRLAEDTAFQRQLGELDLELRIARTLLYNVARSDYERVTAGRELELRELVERRTVLSRVGELATAVVDGCYHRSGTTGLFESSALQRRLRDIHAVIQHALFTMDALGPSGALLLGEEVEGLFAVS